MTFSMSHASHRGFAPKHRLIAAKGFLDNRAMALRGVTGVRTAPGDTLCGGDTNVTK